MWQPCRLHPRLFISQCWHQSCMHARLCLPASCYACITACTLCSKPQQLAEGSLN